MDVASGSNYSHLARVKAWPTAPTAWPFATISIFGLKDRGLCHTGTSTRFVSKMAAISGRQINTNELIGFAYR